MSAEHRNLTLTLMLLFLIDVLCNTWKVEFQEQQMCAVKGSSVVILCSFYKPGNLRVIGVRWGHVNPRNLRGRIIFDSNASQVSRRYQYIGDNRHNCSLKINQVMQNDTGKYIITLNNPNKDHVVGPMLKVVDLKVLITKTSGSETMKEGDSVNLTCINRCDARDLLSAFTWFKNGAPIYEGSGLYLSNISSENSGNYTCSLKTQAGTASGVMNINVEYGPKNTSVSVRPSTEADTNSNISLICSSHSNPPVENYTWFKLDDDFVEVGHQPVFSPGDRGQYLCSVTNKHGSQNSSAVNLKMKSYWAVFSIDVLIIVTVSIVALLSIGTTIIAVRRLNKKGMCALKTDCEDNTQNSYYVNWFICDNNNLQEEKSQCEGGTTEVIYATLDFKNTRTSNMGQQMDSDEDVI